MITNGPKIRLKSAPGRRMVSRTSLPKKDVVRVQVLSSPRNASRIADTPILLFSRVVVVCPSAQLGEDLVEGWSIFATRNHFDAIALDDLQHPRCCRAGIVADDQEVTWGVLSNRAHAWDGAGS